MAQYSKETTAFLDDLLAWDFLVLDTETTGLKDWDEICQIGIIDCAGTVRLDQLVQPQRKIAKEATKIHGISDEMVAEAPSWKQVRERVINIISGQHIIVYNAIYDRRMMHQSDRAQSLSEIEYKHLAKFSCAMIPFAEIYGEWNDYRGNYRWQTLTTALGYYGLTKPLDAHTALTDCRSTLAVLGEMRKRHANE